MDEFNPYAAPEAGVSRGHLSAEADEGRGVWRDEKTLVMAKVARLPSRCVKCNAPAASRLEIAFSWHNPLCYLMLLLFPVGGPFLYLILALTVRRTATVAVPVCERHRAGRARSILVSWVVGLSGLILVAVVVARLVTSGPDPDELPGLGVSVALLLGVGSLMILVGIFHGLLRGRILRARKIDKTHVWLNDLGPLYLADLPPLPGSDKEEAGVEKPRTFGS